jgi:hypothetical protein
MIEIRGLAAGAMVLTAGFVLPGPASAGPLWDRLCGKCPPPSYSDFRYLTPTLARGYDCVKGPYLGVAAPDRHPEIPGPVIVLKYPCRPALPEATLMPVPTAPLESGFDYFKKPTSGGDPGDSGAKQPGEPLDKPER